MDLGTIASETKMSFYGVDHALFAKVYFSASPSASPSPSASASASDPYDKLTPLLLSSSLLNQFHPYPYHILSLLTIRLFILSSTFWRLKKILFQLISHTKYSIIQHQNLQYQTCSNHSSTHGVIKYYHVISESTTGVVKLYGISYGQRTTNRNHQQEVRNL